MILASAVTLTLGLVLPCILIPVLAHLGVVDTPNERSSHDKTTVRGGGVGVLAALMIGLILLHHLVEPTAANGAGLFLAAALTVLFLGVVGLVEDVAGLPVGARMALQLVGGVLAALGLFASGELSVPWAAGSVVALIYAVNATNFMDGINGLSSAHGAVVGTYFAVLGLVVQDRLLAGVGLVVAAAFLSFLPWNFPRARAFLGDVGSYALGATGWALLVWGIVDGLPLVVLVAPFSIYAVDVISTLVSRVARHQSLTTAHRDHIYQRIARRRTHGFATAIVTALTLVGASTSLLVLIFHLPLLWVYGALAASGLVYLLCSTWVGYRTGPVLITSEHEPTFDTGTRARAVSEKEQRELST